MFKKRAPMARLGGWFVRKSYAHFDMPMSFDDARQYVIDPQAISRHQFYPFLSFTKSQRRFTKAKAAAGPQARVKTRALAMPSHRDGYVFAWYSQQLALKYEAFICAAGLSDNVLAYRAGLGTNIALAEDAFSELASRPASLAVALDLKDFFPSIDHLVLKANWSKLLGTRGLPAEHFAVFRAMTRFAEVELNSCYERLNIQTSAVPRPLCTARVFRALIRGEAVHVQSLIKTNQLPYGIPQGAQISALLSNISMIEFDLYMKQAATALGGSYRRYSDDILCIVDPAYTQADVVAAVEDGLKLLGKQMKLNVDKTEAAYFTRGPIGELVCDRREGIQYLGFSFDGGRRMIRAQTMSKYARRMVLAARGAKKSAARAGTPVHKRALYRRFSHLGKSNFITRYVEASKTTMPGDAVRRQVRRHMKRISQVLDRFP